MKSWDDFLAKPDAQAQRVRGWDEFMSMPERDFARGAEVALRQTPALAKGFVGLVGGTMEKVFGEGGISTGIKNWGLRGFEEGMRGLQPLQRDTDDVTIAWERAKEGNRGALIDWAQYAMGYGLGQIGETVGVAALGALAGGATAGPAGAIGGAVAGAAGKTAAKGVIKGLVEKAIEREMARIAASDAGKGLSEQALREAATRSVSRGIGAVAALGAWNIGIEGGAIYPEAVEEAAKRGEEMSGADIARVWGATTAAALTETATDLLGLGAATGRITIPGAGGRVARGAVGALLGGSVEAGQELAQTYLERIGAAKDVWDDDAKREYINAAAMAFLPGMAVGGVSGALYRPRAAVAREEPGPQEEGARMLPPGYITPPAPDYDAQRRADEAAAHAARVYAEREAESIRVQTALNDLAKAGTVDEAVAAFYRAAMSGAPAHAQSPSELIASSVGSIPYDPVLAQQAQIEARFAAETGGQDVAAQAIGVARPAAPTPTQIPDGIPGVGPVSGVVEFDRMQAREALEEGDRLRRMAERVAEGAPTIAERQARSAQLTERARTEDIAYQQAARRREERQARELAPLLEQAREARQEERLATEIAKAGLGTEPEQTALGAALGAAGVEPGAFPRAGKSAEARAASTVGERILRGDHTVSDAQLTLAAKAGTASIRRAAQAELARRARMRQEEGARDRSIAKKVFRGLRMSPAERVRAVRIGLGVPRPDGTWALTKKAKELRREMIQQGELVEEVRRTPPQFRRPGTAPVSRGLGIEIAPAPGSAAEQRFDELPPVRKRALTKAIADAILPEALREAGVSRYEVQHTIGGYKGKTNPSLVVRLGEDVSYDEMTDIARLLGYIFGQESVIVYDESIKTGEGIAGFVKVEPGRELSYDEKAALFRRISERVPEAEGFTARDGALVFGNFSDTPDQEFRDKIDAALREVGGDYNVSLHRFRSDLIFTNEATYGQSDVARPLSGRDGIRRAGRARALQERAESLLWREFARFRAETQADGGGGRARGDRVLPQPLASRPRAAPADAERGPGEEQGRTDGGVVPGERDQDAVVGFHYGGVAGLSSLDGSRYGTGAPGAERAWVSASKDPRLRRRVYFYPAQRDGSIPPAEGVVTGGHVYRLDLDRIYDRDSDRGGLVARWRDQYGGRAEYYDRLESMILDAGYRGYVTRRVGPHGMGVVLGETAVGTQYLGTRQQVRERMARPQASRAARMREARFAEEQRIQLGFLERRAREAGFGSVDEFAARDQAGFIAAAEEFRASRDPREERSVVNRGVDPNASPEEKVRQLVSLAKATRPMVERLAQMIRDATGFEVSVNEKRPERILEKSRRPEIRAVKPWFDVEHVRDALRFKVVVDDVTEMPAVVRQFRRAGFRLVKWDDQKLFEPKEYGFRIVAADLRAPNGMLVEAYFPLPEMEAAKKGPHGHALFERWRNKDVLKMSAAEYAQYEAAMARSRAAYRAAWEAYLARTAQDEREVRASLMRAEAAASSVTRVNISMTLPSENRGASSAGTQRPSMRTAANPAPSLTNATRPAGMSPSASDSQANTIARSLARVRNALTAKFGERGIAALERQGILEIVGSLSHIPPAARRGMRATDEAIYYDGTAYLIAPNIAPGREVPVLLHEIGEHYGLERMLGAEEYRKVLDRVAELRDDPQVRDIWAEVKESYPEQSEGDTIFLKEVLARLGENEAFRRRPLWARIVAAVKRFLRSLGMDVSLSADDLQALISASLRKAMRSGPIPNRAHAPAASATPEPFYSALARELERGPERASAAQWRGFIAGMKGVKRDEIEWSGIMEYLDLLDPSRGIQYWLPGFEPPKIAKSTLVDLVRNRTPVIEETTLTEPDEDAINEEMQLISHSYLREAEEEFVRDNAPLYRIIEVDKKDEDGEIRTVWQVVVDEAEGSPEYRQLLEDAIGEDAYYDSWREAHDAGERALQSVMYGVYDDAAQYAEETAPWDDIRERAIERLNRYEDAPFVQYKRYSSGVGDGYFEAIISLPEDFFGTATYDGPHFNIPNALVHYRGTYLNNDGKTYLALEEVQSDWAKDIRRKRTGIGDRNADTDISRNDFAIERSNMSPRTPYVLMFGDRSMGEFASHQDAVVAMEEYLSGRRTIGGRRGYAPFIHKTEAWVGLALKHALRRAVEDGVDRIAWTSGLMQAKRYQKAFAEAVRRIVYSPSEHYLYAERRDGSEIRRFEVRPEALPDYIGNSLAKQLLATPIEEIEGYNAPVHELEVSEEITIVDPKAGKLYDEVIPNVMNDLAKKLGGGRVQTEHLGYKWGETRYLEITPEMRTRILRGMPLFSREVSPGDFRRQLRRIRDMVGNKKTRDQATHEPIIVFSQTPKVLRDAGLDHRFTLGTGSTIYLKSQDMHWASDHRGAVPEEIVEDLPELLADPLAIYRSDERGMNPHSLRVVLKATHAGKHVMVAIDPRGQFASGADRVAVNFIRSIYMVPKEQMDGWEKRGLRVEMKRGAEAPQAATQFNTGRVGPNVMLPRSAAESKPLASRKPAWYKTLSPEQRDALDRVMRLEDKPLGERLRDLARDAARRFRQGLFDQFDPIKRLDYKAYMLARMSKSTDGALEALLLYGKPYMDEDGAMDVRLGSGLIETLQQLQGETDRFLTWIAAQRAKRLKEEGRENLFTDDDISSLSSLDEGQMPDGASRPELYRRVLKEFNGFGKAVLDIAEKAGLFNADERSLWEHDFYVPFYRVLEEGGAGGPRNLSGLVGQHAFKRLKGGRERLNDLLANTLRNWSHLLSASAKNVAAREALLSAERLGGAIEVPEPQIGKEMRLGVDAVFFLDEGRKRYFLVEDPLLLDAVSALEQTGFSGLTMKAASKFKALLTRGVTLSPSFRIRNLIRDSLSAMAVTPLRYNPVANALNGWTKTAHDNPLRAHLLASGGILRFGSWIEAARADHIRRLIEAGVDENAIVDRPHKVRAMLGKIADWWDEVGDRAENANRASLYEQLRAQGMSHLEASFHARDLMDFSMSGSFRAVRVLTQVVPFLNARMQGLYKLGRDGVAPTARVIYNSVTGQPIEATDAQKAMRFSAVTGAVALASMLLYLTYKDDEDWKRREDWDKDLFWWFKIGDKAYRIPKPFEVGAIGTLAERTLEQIVDEGATGKLFAERLLQMLSDTFALNPTPQLVKPLIDVYANVDSFTGRAIESPGMERLSKPERFSVNTSLVARYVGRITGADVFGEAGLSPAQIDFLVRGYLGWMGAHAVMAADLAIHPFTNEPSRPARRLDDYLVLRDFVREMPANQSRFVTLFYKQAREIETAYADMRHYVALGQMERARAIFEREGDKIRLHRLVTNAKTQLSAIRNREQIVRASSMSPEEKRAELDRLAQLRNRLAEMATERMQPTRREPALAAR